MRDLSIAVQQIFFYGKSEAMEHVLKADIEIKKEIIESLGDFRFEKVYKKRAAEEFDNKSIQADSLFCAIRVRKKLGAPHI